MKLLEYYDDNNFIYERRSIILNIYFFQETHQAKSHVYYKDYQSDSINCQYNHLVCATCIKLMEVQSRKKWKVKKWRMSKVDHDQIIEDDIPL